MMLGFIAVTYLPAQVGINTQDPQAMLDIQSIAAGTQKVLVLNNGSNKEVLTVFDNGSVGLGVTYPGVILDLRDGTNNSIVAVGTSAETASKVGKGVIKYDTAKNVLFLSTGTDWNELSANNIKACVVADIQTATQSFVSGAGMVPVKNWTKTTDITNSFNETTGVFTAPRKGRYSVLVTLTVASGAVNAGSYLEVTLVPSTLGGWPVKCFNYCYANTTQPVFVQCAGDFQLSPNETITAKLLHNLGTNKTLALGYNNISIIEN